jgi:polyisoprenoid-binding protein YceI
METMSIVAMGAVGVLSFFSILRRNEKVNGLVYLLVVLSLLLVIGDLSIATSYGNLLYLSIALFSLVFIVSHFQIAVNWWFKLFLTSIAYAGFVMLGDDAVSGEYVLSLSSVPGKALLLFALVAPYIMSAKLSIFERFIGAESNQLRSSLQLFIVGFLFFVASFLFALPGVALVAVGFTVSSTLSEPKWRNVSVGLLLMTIVLATMEFAQIDEIDLSMGKVVLGLFIGAFLTVFTYSISGQNKPIWWVLFLISALVFGVPFLVVILGTQKADLGGTDAFLGGLVGMVVALLLSKDHVARDLVVILMVLSGLIAIPLTFSDENPTPNRSAENKSVQSSVFDSSANLSLDGLAGNFFVDPSAFRFDFELGPKGGRTRGAFKEVDATVELTGELRDAKFSVALPIRSLTTFNKFRDESLMSEEYFSADKYGQVTFQSVGMKSENGMYVLDGKFIMLGMEKDQVVQLKYMGEKEGKHAFVGKGSLDRRDFGMRSDPKEGNVVDFEFEIILVKK